MLYAMSKWRKMVLISLWPYAMRHANDVANATPRKGDRIPSTTPGAEPPRGTKDSGSARSHSTHLETSSQKRP